MWGARYLLSTPTGATTHTRIRASILGRNLAAALLACALASSACSRGDPTGPRWDSPVDPLILTPSVAASLTPSGYFPSLPITADGVHRITADSALLISEAFLQLFGPLKLDNWVSDHGAEFSLAELRRCGPLLAADRRYVFDESAPGIALRNFASGWYIVQYCGAGGRARVLISVSAASSVQVNLSGSLDSIGPNSFFDKGIPQDAEGLLIPTPERAAEIAHRATGRRIASVPRLFVSTFPDAPSLARWSIDLEDTVVVRGTRSGTVVSTSRVFVGPEESAYPFSGIVALLGLSLSAPGLDRDSLPDIGSDPIVWRPVQIRHGLPASVEPFTLVP